MRTTIAVIALTVGAVAPSLAQTAHDSLIAHVLTYERVREALPPASGFAHSVRGFEIDRAVAERMADLLGFALVDAREPIICAPRAAGPRPCHLVSELNAVVMTSIVEKTDTKAIVHVRIIEGTDGRIHFHDFKLELENDPAGWRVSRVLDEEIT